MHHDDSARIQEGGVRAIVLGVAQDGGLPQMGCGCDNCRRVRSGEQPGSGASSVALVDDRRREFWVLDAGPDFPRQYDQLAGWLGASYRMAGIVVTHAHVGHYLGLVYLGREVMGTRAIPVVGSPRMMRFLRVNGPFSQLVSVNNIRLDAQEPNGRRRLSTGLAIELWPVPHRQEFSDTMAVLVRGPHRSLLYLPDIDRWEAWDRNLLEVVRSVDVALLDGTFFDDGELPNRPRAEIPHPTVRDTAELLAAVAGDRAHRVYFTHLNHSNRLWDPRFRDDWERGGFGVSRVGQEIAL